MLVAKIQVSGVSANVVCRKTIPSGIIGAQIEIDYAAGIWQGLRKTVVFRSAFTKDVITDDNVVTIPAEVVSKPNVVLYVGVYGVDSDGKLAIPTLWAKLGVIWDATDPSGDESTNPALPVWAEILDKANTAEHIAQSLRQDAEAGRFDGAPGADGHTPEKGVDYFTADEVAEIEAGAAEKLKPELSKVKDDLAAEVKRATEAEDNRIKKFYTGNLGAVSIADSDDGAVRNLVIGGKCEQLQTAGINLYHNFKTGQEKEASGIKFTAVENDGISVVGTSVTTANSSGAITPYLSNLSDGKRYTCRTFCDDVKGAFIIKKADGSTSYVSKFVYDSGEIVSVYPYFEVIGGVTIDTVIYPMVCEEAYVSQPYEPYTGGAPSPSPEYPQEIRSVENCTVTISNADGTETQTAPIPVTLRGIGDVRDELYVYADGTGKLVQRVGSYTISGLETWITHSNGVGAYTLIDLGQKKTNDIGGVFSHFKMGSINQRDGNAFIKGDSIQIRIDSVSTRAELKTWLAEHQVSVIFDLDAPIETTLTAEQVKALFDLRTCYGGTNVTFQSDNGVEPVVNFDYACALENFVEYIKAAQGDDRKFIYDMDERMTDAEYVAALAYVNSEYAAALTELEV